MAKHAFLTTQIPPVPPVISRKTVIALPKSAAPAQQLLLACALEAAPVGLIVLDRQHRVQMFTGRAATLLGLERGAKRLRLPVARVLARCAHLDADSLRAIQHGLRQAESHPADMNLTVKQGGLTHTLFVDVRSAGQQGYVVSIEDVTQSRQTQDWLLEHVSTDPVTGLWNRQHFMLMLHDVLTSRQSQSIMLVALDGFKTVNASLGNAAGDALLRLVGDRLSGVLGEFDMIARFSGDEFILALATGPEGPSAEFCEDLMNRICSPYPMDGQLISLSVHAGVARAPLDGTDADMLVANAGLALLESRSTGSTPLRFFEPGLTQRAQQRRALEADLAMALDRGEFELFYQPQVNVHQNCVTGMEALIRWRSPARGMVPPIQFIPLAEQMGLIDDIGDWVLREACREAVHWPAHVTVAVNASPLQFETGDFAADVAAALAESGLEPHRLEIEITENLLLRDTGTVLATLDALHAQGVRLVLDDFGTGYASLSQLSRFRFDKIKIDRSFVSPAETSLQNSAIVRSIAALGHSLGIPTTAEGVETARQLEQIKADGCTSVQGYFFSRPVPGGEVAKLMDRLQNDVAQEAA